MYMAEGTEILWLALLISAGISTWVYFDAKKNSQQSATLWALGTFFGSLVVTLLYFPLGRDYRTEEDSNTEGEMNTGSSHNSPFDPK